MTTNELADILVKAGLVDRRAVDDPEHFDNYVTAGRISEAAIMVTAHESADSAKREAGAAKLPEAKFWFEQ